MEDNKTAKCLPYRGLTCVTGTKPFDLIKSVNDWMDRYRTTNPRMINVTGGDSKHTVWIEYDRREV